MPRSRDAIARWCWDQVKERFAGALGGTPVLAAGPKPLPAAVMNLTAPDKPVLVLTEYGTGEADLTAAHERTCATWHADG